MLNVNTNEGAEEGQIATRNGKRCLPRLLVQQKYDRQWNTQEIMEIKFREATST